MRRTSSDLTSQQSIQKQIQSNYALQLTHNTSKTYTVSNLKDWRLQFEKGQNLTVDTNTDTKLFDNASTVSPCSPSDSLSSTDEGFTYEFGPNDQFLGDLNSPKEQRLRSSSITDVGGGTHLHSIVLANNTIQMRNMLKPLLDQDSPESKDNSYKEQLLTMLSTSDRTGSTPLFLCKSAVMCDLLLNAGANPNHRSKGGLTPLHRSSLFARVDVVCRLIEGGARTNMLDDRGRSALDASKERLLKARHKNNHRLKAVVMLLSEEEERKSKNDPNTIERLGSIEEVLSREYVYGEDRKSSGKCCSVQ